MTSLHLDPNASAREEFISDLRAFADLLAARPDLPVGENPYLTVYYHPVSADGHLGGGPGADERIAEVHRVAAILGVDVDIRDGQHRATLESGCIEYVAAADTAERWARYEAEQSYRGAVQPDLVGA